jgi:hypothetical protein
MNAAVERKRQRDTGRSRKGKKQKRNHRILQDPTHLAFPGWETEEGVWKHKTVKNYIAWCHIGKLFPHHRHEKHVKLNSANLHYCKHDEFVQRCIEVWRFLYKGKNVMKNEVSLSIAQMVYAEVILEKAVDWSTIKRTPHTFHPTEQDIPRAPLSENPREGLTTPKKWEEGPADEEYVWTNPNSDEEEDQKQEQPTPLLEGAIGHLEHSLSGETSMRDLEMNEACVKNVEDPRIEEEDVLNDHMEVEGMLGTEGLGPTQVSIRPSMSNPPETNVSVEEETQEYPMETDEGVDMGGNEEVQQQNEVGDVGDDIHMKEVRDDFNEEIEKAWKELHDLFGALALEENKCVELEHEIHKVEQAKAMNTTTTTTTFPPPDAQDQVDHYPKLMEAAVRFEEIKRRYKEVDKWFLVNDWGREEEIMVTGDSDQGRNKEKLGEFFRACDVLGTKISKVTLAISEAKKRLMEEQEKVALDPMDRIKIAEEGQSSEGAETAEELVEKLSVCAEQERLIKANIETLCIANKAKEKFRKWYQEERSKPGWRERHVNESWEDFNQAAATSGSTMEEE